MENEENIHHAESEKKPKKKNKKQKQFTWIIGSIVAITLIALIAFGYYLVNFMEKPKTASTAVATVNGEDVSLEELNNRYDKLPPQYQSLVTKNDLLDQLINLSQLFVRVWRFA